MKKGKVELEEGELNLSTKLFGLLIAIVIGLVIDRSNFLLFHSIVELLCVVIGMMIVVVSINTLDKTKRNIISYLGISYGFIAMLDLLHTLSYKGMNVFNITSANIPTQLWISARYMESISILISIIYFHYNKKINNKKIISIYTIISLFLIGSIFRYQIFPTCYIEGIGLTLFKKISEFLIIGILILSSIIIGKNKNKLNKKIYNYIKYSIIATITSEIFFVFYIGVYDSSNVIGHIFKIISYYFIYNLIIET